jgi:hypothetical protein
MLGALPGSQSAPIETAAPSKFGHPNQYLISRAGWGPSQTPMHPRLHSSLDYRLLAPEAAPWPPAPASLPDIAAATRNMVPQPWFCHRKLVRSGWEFFGHSAPDGGRGGPMIRVGYIGLGLVGLGLKVETAAAPAIADSLPIL